MSRCYSKRRASPLARLSFEKPEDERALARRGDDEHLLLDAGPDEVTADVAPFRTVGAAGPGGPRTGDARAVDHRGERSEGRVLARGITLRHHPGCDVGAGERVERRGKTSGAPGRVDCRRSLASVSAEERPRCRPAPSLGNRCVDRRREHPPPMCRLRRPRPGTPPVPLRRRSRGCSRWKREGRSRAEPRSARRSTRTCRSPARARMLRLVKQCSSNPRGRLRRAGERRRTGRR